MEFNNNKGEYKFPYEINFVDPETNKELLQYYQGERTGFVQVGPNKYFFPCKYKESAEKYYNFYSRPDDIWVASFPRSGTTWTQELVWLIANNLDYATAKLLPLTQRFPFFEFSNFMHADIRAELLKLNDGDEAKQSFIDMASRPGYELFDEMNGQRFIKTHFPFSLLPPSIMENRAKIIYVARNPKDVAVSYFHLNRLYRTQGYIGEFDKFWDFFERNLNAWMPYWTHLEEGWSRRNEPNVLFMFYEDMCKDFPATIRKVAEFLGKQLDDEQIAKLGDYLSITNFRNNPAVNGVELREVHILKTGEQGFVRRGKTGGWQEEFTPELMDRANRWIQQNLKNTDMRFPE